MKRYHEAANVRIGDSIVACFLQDTQTLKDPYDTKAIASLPWLKVSSAEFGQLVRQDKIQFLTVENDKIVCHLTDEERKLLTKNKLKKNYIDAMEKDCWHKDPGFDKEYIGFAERGEALAVCVSEIVSLLGMKLMAFQVYGLSEHIDFISSNAEKLKQSGLIIMTKGTNHLTFAIPAGVPDLVTRIAMALTVPIKAHPQLISTQVLVDTVTIRRTLGDTERKAGGFVKTIGAQKYVSILDHFDDLTAINLAGLNSIKCSDTTQTGAEQTSVFG